MTLKGKINSVIHHPSILRDVIEGKSSEEIQAKVRSLDVGGKGLGKQVPKFISHLKRTSPYHVNPNDKLKLNRLCYVEDSENSEIMEILSSLQQPFSRRSWEWAQAILAMRRFGKLNNNSKAIGIASATEPLLFYLANNVKHVYATDLYDSSKDRHTPSDFPENPKKYAPFPYKEDALTVLRMNATNLEFPSDTFDIAFSISSIEHFGGKNHSGALRCLKEIERVLKTGGIATITTEYILNDKDHQEFFNKRTIYDDLINKLQKLQLVEPLDLRITTKTLDAATGLYDNVYPHILLRYGDTLFTSIMLVFQKQ
ncbi:MAG TPA: class I SAM-dependent methyltransferase [Nitrososphaeraceae archaeon]